MIFKEKGSQQRLSTKKKKTIATPTAIATKRKRAVKVKRWPPKTFILIPAIWGRGLLHSQLTLTKKIV